ncbi:MAG: glutathione binding-like protein [Kiloniellales bacterium]|nr:glutathione binding-like protein [Kiloniellales bacterium]MDJ0969478.1 glutathione binding-like protein [Kiloniellales bacterium]
MTIELYTWSTPNGRKVSIALEEMDLGYNTHPINITKDEQFDPDFLKISPNNKIPAIVDPEGPDGGPFALFETGAILIYLAEKTGRFLPQDAKTRHVCMQWLMWQMGGFGPMLGQAHHFRRFAPEQIPYAVERYTKETARLYRVLDGRLAEAAYLAGDYTIADMATFPWAARHEWQGIALEDYPNVKRWYDGIAARPGVARGMAVPS